MMELLFHSVVLMSDNLMIDTIAIYESLGRNSTALSHWLVNYAFAPNLMNATEMTSSQPRRGTGQINNSKQKIGFKSPIFRVKEVCGWCQREWTRSWGLSPRQQSNAASGGKTLTATTVRPTANQRKKAAALCPTLNRFYIDTFPGL